ncbi:MAG: amino acid ABC transporter substrate-binding protein [Mycobacterium sp.]|nr:amino acid ABC transporter substrate-binding protein [Mycobacterium sp.]
MIQLARTVSRQISRHIPGAVRQNSGASPYTPPMRPRSVIAFAAHNTHNLVMNMPRLIALLVTCLVATAASAQFRIPSDSRLQTITTKKTIKIAYRTDARPFSFVNDRNEPVGFSIDICKLVVSSIERQFGLDHVNVEWVPVTVQTRFSTVASGKADMECGSSTVTLGRMKEVDFSNFIFVESTGLAISRASNIRSFADMVGRKIAVVSGSSNEHAIATVLKQNNFQATLVPVKSGEEGMGLLEAGKVDGFASDKLLLAGANIKDPDKLIMLPDDLSVEPYGIVLPQGDWALRLAVNTGLAQIFRSEQLATVFRGWFDRAGLQMGPVQGIVYGLGALSD